MRMIHAKNYETVFKFVKVMPRILVASFFPDTCLWLYVISYEPVHAWFSASQKSDFRVLFDSFFSGAFCG